MNAPTNFPDYPFTPQNFVHADGLRQSFLDEGPRDGEVVVMLHGNPSWSFYWRQLVLGLRDRYRCIVPDHIGMGLSRQARRCAVRVHAAVARRRPRGLARAPGRHRPGDAGGARLGRHDRLRLGAGAQRARQAPGHPQHRLVPAAGRQGMPWRLRLGRDSKLGGWADPPLQPVRARRGALGHASARCRPTCARLRRRLRRLGQRDLARCASCRTSRCRPAIAPGRWWKRPAGSCPSYADRPAFLGWGLTRLRVRQALPGRFPQGAAAAREQHVFADAGHYMLEDKAEELVPAIRAFLDRHPL